mmetsp:Transcript_139435/g.242718  ORF Transcript_139435/g.242718 Transcript_139435/m.242718 type:complete len:80 (-) Transcript_139435:2513-2752(-)
MPCRLVMAVIREYQDTVLDYLRMRGYGPRSSRFGEASCFRRRGAEHSSPADSNDHRWQVGREKPEVSIQELSHFGSGWN